jgi:predicted lactoylglutathione lyase
MAEMHIESINAVTLAVHDMSQSVRFYTMLGFSARYGGEHAAFTSLHAGSCYLNLIEQPVNCRWSWWGSGRP